MKQIQSGFKLKKVDPSAATKPPAAESSKSGAAQAILDRLNVIRGAAAGSDDEDSSDDDWSDD